MELPEIARDDHYDFNFQEYHSLRNEVYVKPVRSQPRSQGFSLEGVGKSSGDEVG